MITRVLLPRGLRRRDPATCSDLRGLAGDLSQAICATALIDRTVHDADVIAIEGDNYRHREAETDKKGAPDQEGCLIGHHVRVPMLAVHRAEPAQIPALLRVHL